MENGERMVETKMVIKMKRAIKVRMKVKMKVKMEEMMEVKIRDKMKVGKKMEMADNKLDVLYKAFLLLPNNGNTSLSHDAESCRVPKLINYLLL